MFENIKEIKYTMKIVSSSSTPHNFLLPQLSAATVPCNQTMHEDHFDVYDVDDVVLKVETEVIIDAIVLPF